MSLLAGRFALERELGAGGMGTVYLGRDEVLDWPVAVKVLRGGFEDSGASARFRREGRTAAKLVHPNIVQVYDAGESELDGREASYIVMEYVSGGDLKGLLERKAPLSEVELARIGADVASGLAHAHEKGVVHRDVKPRNVLLDEYGRPKLADFGIARTLDATQATRTGSYLGTASYSSPEQLRGEKVTPKSDIYSLGATLYEAATGGPLFRGSPIEVASQQISQPPDPPRARGATIGAGLEATILSCLAKDPGDRPTAEDLRAQLLQTGARAASSPAGTGGAGAAVPGGAGAVEALKAAGVAGLAGLAGAGKVAGKAVGAAREAGAAGVGAARNIDLPGRSGASGPRGQAVGAVPGTAYRRNFGSGRNRAMVLAAGAAGAVVLVLVLAVVLLPALRGGGAEGQQAKDPAGSEAAGQEAASNAPGGNGAASEATAAEAVPDANAGEASDPPPVGQSAAPEDAAVPAPPPEEAGQAVLNMYTATAERDVDTSWNLLSSRLRGEIGSKGKWKKSVDELGPVRFDGSIVGEPMGDGTARVVISGRQIVNGEQAEISGAWICVSEGGGWKLDSYEPATSGASDDIGESDDS